jgi:hypothetical protein
VLTATALASGSKRADPRQAARALVQSLPDCHRCSATKVVHRDGDLWLGVANTDQPNRERARIFRWEGGHWRRVADVRWRGWGATQWPKFVSLTGSSDPDLAVVGLFNRSAVHPDQWRLMSLDDGLSLPTAPAIYDLPPSLLIALEHRLGPNFKPIGSATRLVGRLLLRYHGDQSSGLVRARGRVLAGRGWPRPAHAFGRDLPVEGATVDSRRNRFSRPPPGGSVGSVVRVGTGPARSRVRASGSGGLMATPGLSKVVLTNAGGRWRVAVR